ncbi:DUF7007 domain-containing protein [Vibrio anguillarum]|uniref:DUF7007 domain-containing protein n=1 Tax=Vibrio anguillarum TaxID=55601 RepID=UPI001561AA83|nr:hypothetical protein [Vibrio anguillarum]
MKITPAHILEAKEMAQSLLDEWGESGMPMSCSLDVLDETPTLVAIQNRLASSFGWDSWPEMISFISEPHEAIYLDNNTEALEKVVSELSKSIGYEYPHGMMFSIVQNSGTGYSPKIRRELALNSTPWGQAIHRDEIAEGIVVVSTASHGGILLSETRSNEIPKHLTLNQLAYEEDDDATYVQLAFPQYFRESLKFNLAKVGVYSASSIPHIHDPKIQEMLDESRSHFSSLFGKQPEEDLSLRRELTPQEVEAIEYLSQCVLRNVKPIVVPDSERPTLQEWAEVLSHTLRVDNKIPRTSIVWKSHFKS